MELTSSDLVTLLTLRTEYIHSSISSPLEYFLPIKLSSFGLLSPALQNKLFGANQLRQGYQIIHLTMGPKIIITHTKLHQEENPKSAGTQLLKNLNSQEESLIV